MEVYNKLKQGGSKKIALLIDPDKCSRSSLEKRLSIAQKAGVSFVLVGGSLLNYYLLDSCVEKIKKISNLPVILFPANGMHISQKADAILFMSLISGRNPDLLIGNHVRTHNTKFWPRSYPHWLYDNGKRTYHYSTIC